MGPLHELNHYWIVLEVLQMDHLSLTLLGLESSGLVLKCHSFPQDPEKVLGLKY